MQNHHNYLEFQIFGILIVACNALPLSPDNTEAVADNHNSTLTAVPVLSPGNNTAPGLPNVAQPIVEGHRPIHNSTSAIATKAASEINNKPPGKSNADKTDKDSSDSSTNSSSEERVIIKKKEKSQTENEKDAELAAEKNKEVTHVANSTSEVPRAANVAINEPIVVPSSVSNSTAALVTEPYVAPSVIEPTVIIPAVTEPSVNVSASILTVTPTPSIQTPLPVPVSPITPTASLQPPLPAIVPTIPPVIPAASEESQQPLSFSNETQSNYTAGFNKGLELDFFEYFKVLQALSAQKILPKSPIIAVVKVPPGNSVKPQIEGFIPRPFSRIEFPVTVADIVPLTPINEPIKWQQSTKSYNLIPKNGAATVLRPRSSQSDNSSPANAAMNITKQLSSIQPGTVIKDILLHQIQNPFVNRFPKQQQNNQMLSSLLAPKPKTNSILDDLLNPPQPSLSDVVNLLMDSPPKHHAGIFGQSNNALVNLLNGPPQNPIDSLLSSVSKNPFSKVPEDVALLLEPLVLGPQPLTVSAELANLIVGPPHERENKLNQIELPHGHILMPQTPNLLNKINQFINPPKPSISEEIASLLTRRNQHQSPLDELVSHNSPLGQNPKINEALQLLSPDVMQPKLTGLAKIEAEVKHEKRNDNIMDRIMEPPLIQSPHITKPLDVVRRSIPMEALDMLAPKVLQPSRLVQDPLPVQPLSNADRSQTFNLKIKTLPNIINPLNILHSKGMKLRLIENGDETVTRQEQRLAILAKIQQNINHVIKHDMFIQNALIANRPVGLMLTCANQEMQPVVLIPDLTL